MSSLKQSIFWLAAFLGAVFVLAQFDYTDSPIIDFAKYFYFMVMVSVPATIFFPYTTRVSAFVVAVVWGSVYFVMFQVLDRTASAPNTTLAIILLEFGLVIFGVWLAYQLANGIRHAESIIDSMALSAFPNRTQSIAEASKQIRVEITRSRRYHRPLSLIVLQPDISASLSFDKMMLNIQHDIWNRFSFARIGQVVDETIRQTDMVFRDPGNRFIILCPETAYGSAQILAQRIGKTVGEKMSIKISWGVAAFPDDALNFDDLMDAALARLAHPPQVYEEETHEALTTTTEAK
jgi:GGDEF domain-containing protein